MVPRLLLLYTIAGNKKHYARELISLVESYFPFAAVNKKKALNEI